MALCCLAAWQAPGAQIAYEGFSSPGYTDSAALGGLGGGTGWNSAWSASSSCQVLTSGMAYASGSSVLLAAGGKLQCIGGSGSRVIATGTGSPARNAGVVDTSNNIGADGTTVWVSFLGQCPVAGADFGISFTRPGAPVAYPQTGIIGLGGPQQWRFWPQANLTGVPATGKVLMVWRIDFGAGNNDTCRVWINPVPGIVPSDGAANLSGGGGDWSFNRVDFSGGSATTLWFDELRIGTAYADVGPLDPSPSPPAGPQPADGAANISITTLLDWNDSIGADGYDVFLWKAGDTRPGTPSTTVSASQFASPERLTPFTVYNWQAAAKNQYGSTTGPVWSFTTDDGRPTAPTAPFPANGAIKIPEAVTLSWAGGSGAASSQVFLWRAADPQPAAANAAVTSNNFAPTTVLSFGTLYNWQIISANEYGSTTGAVWSFTTTAKLPPPPPTSPIPASGSTRVPANPLLGWTGSTEADGYALYFWLSSGSQPATPTIRLTETNWRAPATLLNNTNYSWQVVATNAYGSATGAVWTFRTASALATNVADGDIYRYPLVVLDGTCDGKSLQVTASPTKTTVSLTRSGKRFRCLADLQPGTNTLTLTDNQGAASVRLVYTPPTSTDWRFKIWYVVPFDEASNPADTNWFMHFGLQTKLMQSWMAEDQLRGGNGRATFYPEMDATNNVDVGMLVLTQTRAEAEALGTGIFGTVYNQIPAAYRDGKHKNVAFTSVNFHALASGDLAYVGAYSPIIPGRVADIIPSLLSLTTAYDGLTFATYTGVTLHEICHTLNSIWHEGSPGSIMIGNYDISQYFTLTLNQSNNTLHNEFGAVTLGPLRDLARWTRYLLSADPRAYTDANISLSIGSEYIDAGSPNPLAVFYHYIPDTASTLHTNLFVPGVSSFRKHLGEACRELGTTSSFNVMAVDQEGNMRYTTFSGGVIPVLPADDTYEVPGNSGLEIAAPGVLANEINPSAGPLAVMLATNALHGVLNLNPNGSFSYRPFPGYAGTDVFWYRAVDSVSSDKPARVTLRVTLPQGYQPPTVTSISGPVAGHFTFYGTAAAAGNVVVWKTISLSPVNWQPIQTNAVSATFAIPIPQGTDPAAFYTLTGP